MRVGWDEGNLAIAISCEDLEEYNIISHYLDYVLQPKFEIEEDADE